MAGVSLIEFGPDPTKHPGGDSTRSNRSIRRDGMLTIAHHLDRWSDRDRDGMVTDVCVYLRFHPQKKVIVRHLAPDPESPRLYRALDVTIPSTCETIELWFRSSWHSEQGDVTECWDSDYGKNYWFETVIASSGGGVF